MQPNNSDAMRRRILLGIGTAVTAGIAGCSGGDDGGSGTDTSTDTETMSSMDTETEAEMTETDTPAGTATVRVAHMSPNAPNVDVYVDGSAVLEDVAFGAVSSSLELPAGGHQVEITAAGDPDASVFSGPVTVAADQAFEPLIMEDDNSDLGMTIPFTKLQPAV